MNDLASSLTSDISATDTLAEYLGPPDPLRPIFKALVATNGAEEKMEAIRDFARELATPIRHGHLDLYEIEERLIDLAASHDLFVDLTQGAVEQVICQALRTPALSDSSAGFDEADQPQFASESPPPNGPEDYGVVALETRKPCALEIVSASDWPNESPPPVSWVVRDKIPRGDVATLDGDGGLGKTMAAIQLAVAVARGSSDWFGLEVMDKGDVLFLSAEEPEREIKRRTFRVAQRGEFNLSELDSLRFWFPDNVGSCLFAMQTRSGSIQPTPLFFDVAAHVIQTMPALVIVDNVAAIYGGEQNHRGMVRSFINLWRGLAHNSGSAILLLNHPSLSGLVAGTGRGGSMDWRNAVRAALHLKPAPDQSDAERGVRVLECVKNNYAAHGAPIRLEWVDGTLTVEGTASPHERAAQNTQADEKFLELLTQTNRLRVDVGQSTGRGYAPKVFADSPDSGGYTSKAFAAAMHRLLVAGRVVIENVGPPSRGKKRLVIAP